MRGLKPAHNETTTTLPGGLAGDGVPLTGFIKATDDASAVVRPPEVGEFYLETEYKHAAEEQIHNYAEKGEEEARDAHVTAAERDHDADHAIAASDAANADAAAARDRQNRAHEVLGPHVRRPTDAKVMKYVRWAFLLGGDIAGIAGAALLLGEEPLNAFLQALSGAVAAVTLGAVGRELRYFVSLRARQKQLSELAEAEKPYAAFFNGPHSGEQIVKILVLACATGVLLIGTGIFALRSSTEGSAAGIVFACLALALGLASTYNSFDTADDVAEHLDNLAVNVKKAEKKATHAREVPVIKQRDRAKAEAASIKLANEHAGNAAAQAIFRLLHAALGNSAGVAGNGTAPTTKLDPPNTAAPTTNDIDTTTLTNHTNGHHPTTAIDA